MNQIRQGDVLLVRARRNAKRGKQVPAESGRTILARGEATGHHHSISAETSTLYDNNVLVVTEPTLLTHQEHASIEIAPGTYWVIRQREYAPQEIRRVMD